MPDFGSPNLAYTPVLFINPATGAPVAPSNSVPAGTADSGNPTKIGGVFNTTPQPVTTGQRTDIQTDARGNLRVYPVLGPAAGADGVSNSGGIGWYQSTTSSSSQLLATVAPFVYNGTTWDRRRKANASSRIPSSANSNNATVAKASAGDVFQINGHNANGAVRYLKLYDKATAPAPATDSALLKAVFALPASSTFNINLGALGLYFGTGISYALVTGAGNTDNTSVGAADILGLNILYH